MLLYRFFSFDSYEIGINFIFKNGKILTGYITRPKLVESCVKSTYELKSPTFFHYAKITVKNYTIINLQGSIIFIIMLY